MILKWLNPRVYLGIISFSSNVLFLVQDPFQDPTLHGAVLLLSFLQTVTIPQPVLTLYDLNSFLPYKIITFVHVYSLTLP